MPQNIFGTDGVRGVANADLSCDLAFRLGRAATKFLGPDICVGRDTRLSGTMLESALTAGIMAEGGRPHCCGVIPTPAVALLTVQNELDGGIVISASHNPPEFNGIKFFSRKGMKLPDAVEEEISAWVMSEEAMAADTLPTGAGVGHIIKMKDARKAYVDHAIDTLDGLRLDGLVVAVDCGHGASCQTTPAALQRLGATVHAINTDYCGTDINVECGSTHLEPLRELVLRTHADIGLAHDGDADRVLFVDSEGNEIDGDYILAICGSDLAARGKLANSEIVSTVMCNLGHKLGAAVVDKLSKSMSLISETASMVGVTVIAGLSATFVKINIGVEFAAGAVEEGVKQSTVNIQGMMDNIAPSLLPMLYMLLMYYLIKKRGWNTYKLVILTVIIGVALSCAGVLI